jgi:hypothetical protein
VSDAGGRALRGAPEGSIRWNVKADGSGAGGAIRELRIHPHNVHLGFNSITVTSGGKFDQFGYLARLEFNAKPTSGAPLAPRYDLTKVTRLFKPSLEQQVLRPHPTRPRELVIQEQGIEVGEFRGFVKRPTAKLPAREPNDARCAHDCARATPCRPQTLLRRTGVQLV